MIRFDLREIRQTVPRFQARVARYKRYQPPGRMMPWLTVSIIRRQDEDSDKWQAWIRWKLFDTEGTFPCRDAAKHETITGNDPPDLWPSEKTAKQFARLCRTALVEQYKQWMRMYFEGKTDAEN